MSYENILTEVRDTGAPLRAALITLNRPKQLNALNRPGFSRADPTWYQTFTATIGVL